MFVPSLDGLSIYDEKPASLTSNGVILGAYESVDISEWGISHEPLQFVGDKSFVSRSGKGTDNVGVVGCIVFRKKSQRSFTSSSNLQLASINTATPVIAYSNAKSDETTASPYAQLSSYSYNDIIGNYDSSDVFIKRDENYPDALMTIYYDSARGLEKRGIKLKYKSPHVPSAFPASRSI